MFVQAQPLMSAPLTHSIERVLATCIALLGTGFSARAGIADYTPASGAESSETSSVFLTSAVDFSVSPTISEDRPGLCKDFAERQLRERIESHVAG